jgi:hypothetical protein
VLAGDYDGANRNIMTLNTLKKQKGELYLQMAAGMREVGGPAVDNYVIQGINGAAQNLEHSSLISAGTSNSAGNLTSNSVENDKTGTVRMRP